MANDAFFRPQLPEQPSFEAPEVEPLPSSARSAQRVADELPNGYQPYLPTFAETARRYQVPVNVLMALAQQESSFNPRAVGQPTQWGTAKGMMQYLDSTAEGLGIDPLDPNQAIDAAARQLRERLDKGYSMVEAVREHFAGPNRDQWGPKTVVYGNEVLQKAQAIGQNADSIFGGLAANPRAFGDSGIPYKPVPENGVPYKPETPALKPNEPQESSPPGISELLAPDAQGAALLGAIPAPDETEVGAWETTKLVAEQLWNAAVYHLPAAVAAAFEGDTPYAEIDWKDTLIERSRERLDEGGNTNRETALPFVTEEDIRSLGPSLGFSVTGMGAGLAAGIPATAAATAAGTLVAPGAGTAAGFTAGITAGAAASGATAYRMATNGFVRDLRAAADIESMKQHGRKLTNEEFAQRMEPLQGLVAEYGLWEAVPEATSNVIGFGVLKAPVKAGIGKLFGNNVLTRLASKTSALYGTELATETITQQGQHNVQIDSGLSNLPRRNWTSGDDLGQSFSEIAPSTILQTTLLAGGTKGAMILQDRIKRAGLTREQYDALLEINTAVESGQFDPEQARMAALRALDPVTPETREPAGPLGRAMDRAPMQEAETLPTPEQEAAKEEEWKRLWEAEGVDMSVPYEGPTIDIQGQPPEVQPEIQSSPATTDSSNGEVASGEAATDERAILSIKGEDEDIPVTILERMNDAEQNIHVRSDSGESFLIPQADIDSGAFTLTPEARGEAPQPPAQPEALTEEPQAEAPPAEVPEVPSGVSLRRNGQPFESFEQAERAMRNRKLRNHKVEQLPSGGWGIVEQEGNREPSGTERAAEQPTQRQDQTIEDMTDEQLEQRIAFLQSRGRSAGWDSRLIAERDRMQAEIERRSAQPSATRDTPEPVSQAVQDDVAPIQTAPTGEAVVEHQTRKGKILRGVLRAIPLTEAREIDPYAFSKDGQSFIRLDRLPEQQTTETPQKPTTPATSPADLVMKKDGSPFASEAVARRAATNRKLKGYQPVAVEGGWALRPETQTDNTTRHQAEIELGVAEKSSRAIPATDQSPRQPQPGGPGYTLSDARNDLLAYQARLAEQGQVADARLADRVRQQQQLVQQMEKDEISEVADQAPTETEVLHKSPNTIFTDDMAERARQVLRSKLSQLNSGIDPEIMQAGITLAGYHIEKGARTFSAYAKVMIDDLGDAVKPYLKSWYMGVKYDPRAAGFEGMDDAATVEAADVDAVTETRNVDPTESPESRPSINAQGDQPASTPSDRRSGHDESRTGRAGERVHGDPRDNDRRSDKRASGDRQPGVRTTPTEDDTESNRADQRGRQDGNRASRRENQGPRDYQIRPGELTRTGSWRETAEQNVRIVELVKQLDSESRPATVDEQQLLTRFTGWGASEIANGVFPDARGHYKDARWKALGERLEAALTPEEYAQARRTTQYAHYTSEAVIRSVYDGMQRMGFSGGTVLEPGMGVGLFKGLMPATMTGSYTGIEYDAMTGRIAQLLYPDSNIIVGDYTATRLPRDFFDAAIGNPPFSRTKVTGDPEYRKQSFMLHDYFFAKTLDRVKPGGMVTFITSKGTMDKASDRARQYLAERANLVGAIRLPQTAFKANAGTEVVTDVLFFQKRAEGIEDNGIAWMKTREIQTPQGPARINEYFTDHPEMVLGKHAMTGSMYRANEYTVEPDGRDIEQAFAEAVEHLPENIYRPERGSRAEQAAVINRDFNPSHHKEGGIYLKDGQLLRVEEGSGSPLTQRNTSSNKTISLKPREAAWLKGYVGVRDALKKAQADQLSDGDWESSLAEVNRAYDQFVKQYGPIRAHTVSERENDDGSTTIIRRFKNQPLLDLDVESPLVFVIEAILPDNSIVKAPALKGRTLARPKQASIQSTQDAMFVSLNQKGRLDLDDIAGLANITQSQVIEELGELIYNDPTAGWVMSDEYLSGDVVKKLKEARLAAKVNKALARNVKALESVQPRPLAPADITAQLGSAWIPASDIKAFASEVMGEKVNVQYSPVAATWSAEGGRDGVSEWSTPARDTGKILEAVLNNRQIKVTFRDNEGKTHTDMEATEQANNIAKKMRDQFKGWIWRDKARAERLVSYYNEHFNNIVPRTFDGSHLTLPGVSMRFDLYPHQKRAIWRTIQTGDTYFAHSVGAGKTFTMIAAGMEERRLGLINKPMYVVPNHMLAQFSKEFLELYPTANIMVADEKNFHTRNRQRFVAQATLNDPDAIVITHSAFGLMGMSDDFQATFINDQIDHMREVLNEADKDDRLTRKRIEQRIEQLENRIKAKTSVKKDQALTFEQMGVDRLYVDEIHEFRKLDFATNRGNVKGIDPSGSMAAMDLHMKVRYLQGKNPGRTLVGASGTPITNTMGELFTVQRLFQPEQLEADGLDSFDAWSNQFGEVVDGFEQNAAGGYQVVSRFARFVNVADLMSRVRSFMDVLTSEQLGSLVQRPNLTGGSREVVVTPTPDGYKGYQRVLNERIKAIQARSGPPAPGDDIILSVIADGRFSAIDMRFVDPALPSDPNSKLNRLLDDVIAAYHDTMNHEYRTGTTLDANKGGNLMVFTDLGLGEASARNRGFDMKAWMRKRLVDGGVDPDHIAFMRDNKAHARKERLFADMREGKKRILIGGKDMETGVNVQKRLIHLFHLDAPWFPAAVEQREGRIIRQGNQNQTVAVKAYASKGSYDSTMWGMIARKARFIEQAMAGDSSLRSMDDVSESSSFEMASALASGDERYLRLAGLKADVGRLSRLYSAHMSEQRKLAGRQRATEDRIRHEEKKIAALEKALTKRKPIAAGEFKGIVGSTTYDSREEFSTAMFEAFKDRAGTFRDGTESVGKVGGFDVVFNGLTLEGSGDYAADLAMSIPGNPEPLAVYPIDPSMSVKGIGTRAANQVNRIDKDLDDARHSLETNQRHLDQIENRVGAAFAEADELSQKQEELNDLEMELAREEASQDAPASTDSKTGPEPDALFSLASTVKGDPDAKGIPVEQARRIAERFMASYNGNVPLKLHVVARQEDVYGPDATRERVGTIKGAYHAASGRLVLAAANLRDARDARDTLTHEVLGHYGLNTFTPAQKREILDAILGVENDVSLKEHWDYVKKHYGDAPGDIQAEEVFARVAEREPKALGAAWNRILAALQKALRKAGLVRYSISEAELHDLAQRIGREIRQGKRHQQIFPKSDSAQFSLKEGPGTTAWQRAEAKGLDMSQAGRMQRAREMGYIASIDEAVIAEMDDAGEITYRKGPARAVGHVSGTDEGRSTGGDGLRAGVRDDRRGNEGKVPRGVPQRFYHGTGDNIEGFQIAHPNRKDAGWLGEGIYLTDNPDLATGYAMAKTRRSVPGQNILPLVVKPKALLRVPFSAKRSMMNATPEKTRKLTEQLRARGFDGVVTTLPGRDGIQEIVLFNEGDIRSTQAAFDPDGEGSTDLLLSVNQGGSRSHNTDDIIGSMFSFHPVIADLMIADKLKVHADGSTIPAARRDGVQGYTDPSGVIHLNAENLTPETARAVLLHEAFHAGTRPLLGDIRWKNLYNRLGKQYQSAMAGHSQGKFWEEALARVERAGTEHETEEFGAYAIEEYENAPATVKKIIDGMVGAIKAWLLRRFGIQAGKITPAQLRHLAKAALGVMNRTPGQAAKAPAVNGLYSVMGDNAPSDRDINRWLKGQATQVTPAVFASSPMDRFANELAKGVPQAQQYLRIKRRMDAYRNRKHNQYDEIAQQWLKLNSKGKKQHIQSLSDLMHQSTLLQHDPSQPVDNTADLTAEERALRKQYRELPEAFRKLYGEVRDAYQSQAKELDQIIIDNISKSLGVQADRARDEHDQEISRIQLSDMTDDQKAEALATTEQRLGGRLARLRANKAARLLELRRQFERSKMKGPYFPLARFGDYFVTVRDNAGEVVAFYRREQASEQQALAKQIRDQGYKVATGYMHNDGDLRKAVDPEFVADVEQILGKSSVDDAVKDQIWNRYLESMPEFSMRKSFIHRKGREGYDRDALRAFSSRMFHSAHQMARLKYGQDLQQQINQAEKAARTRQDSTRDDQIIGEMKKRHDFVMNPTGAAWVQRVTSTAFIYYLSVSPAAAAVNTTQTAIMGVPILGTQFGYARTQKELIRALKDFTMAGGKIANAKLTADESQALSEAYDRGTIDKTQAHDLAGVGETGVQYNARRNKWMSKVAFLYHHAERMNREVTFMAAYRMSRDKGLDHDQAVENASELTWKTHFDYSASNRPRPMQKDWGKVLTIFRNFQVNMLFRLFRDFHQSIKGESKADRREARMQFGATIAMFIANAGIRGTPLFGIAMLLANMFDEDGDAEEDLKRGIIEFFGPSWAGQFMSGVSLNGLWGHVTKTALSERIGFPDLWFRSPNRELEGREQVAYWMEQMLGPGVGMFTNLANRAYSFPENPWRSTEGAAPKFVRDVMKAARYTRDGVLTYRGDPILEYLTPYETLLQAIGFTPIALDEAYERNNALKNREQRILDRRRKILSDFWNAQRREESTEPVIDAIGAFNLRYPEMAITPETVRQSIRSRFRYSARNQGGIVLNPKLEPRLREQTAPALYR